LIIIEVGFSRWSNAADSLRFNASAHRNTATLTPAR
jgi:hypothetical protein